jgi:hypothetical protein
VRVPNLRDMNRAHQEERNVLYQSFFPERMSTIPLPQYGAKVVRSHDHLRVATGVGFVVILPPQVEWSLHTNLLEAQERRPRTKLSVAIALE